MNKLILLLTTVVCVIVGLPINSALAQCREDPREMHFGNVIFRFKSYTCQLPGSDQGTHIGVELYRLAMKWLAWLFLKVDLPL
jgi:hypothetical protein